MVPTVYGRFHANRDRRSAKTAVAEHESLAGLLDPLHQRLQRVKHASTADVTLVRSLLLTVEGF